MLIGVGILDELDPSEVAFVDALSLKDRKDVVLEVLRLALVEL